MGRLGGTRRCRPSFTALRVVATYTLASESRDQRKPSSSQASTATRACKRRVNTGRVALAPSRTARVLVKLVLELDDPVRGRSFPVPGRTLTVASPSRLVPPPRDPVPARANRVLPPPKSLIPRRNPVLESVITVLPHALLVPSRSLSVTSRNFSVVSRRNSVL